MGGAATSFVIGNAYRISASLFAPDWAFFAKERAGWVDRWAKEMT